MTLRCPFCEGALEIGRHWESRDDVESGGILISDEYHCATCHTAITSITVDKLFNRIERWALTAAPLGTKVTRSSHPTLPAYACTLCTSGELLPSVPVGELPTPSAPQTFADRTHRSRQIEYLCNACLQQYLRNEAGSFDALAVVYWNILAYTRAGPSLRNYELLLDAPQERPRVADS